MKPSQVKYMFEINVLMSTGLKTLLCYSKVQISS